MLSGPRRISTAAPTMSDAYGKMVGTGTPVQEHHIPLSGE